MDKYKCPAPSCGFNKKGICCNECSRRQWCFSSCRNNLNKCGAEKEV